MNRAPWPANDPRPDLGDSDRWERLLTAAVELEGNGPRALVGWLRGVRAFGGAIHAKADGRLALRIPDTLNRDVLTEELGASRGALRLALDRIGGAWTCPTCGASTTGASCSNCRWPRPAEAA